eukprot:s5314_g10.t1
MIRRRSGGRDRYKVAVLTGRNMAHPTNPREIKMPCASCTRVLRDVFCRPADMSSLSTYTIRAVPANTNDSVYCSVLGAHAVHVAMAGYTGLVVGKVDERFVMLPNHAITKAPLRRVELKSSIFERMMATTGQPNLAPGLGDDWALLPSPPPPRPEKPPVEPPELLSFAEWNGLNVEEELSWNSVPHTQEVAEVANLEIKDVTLNTFDGFGEMKESRPLLRSDLLKSHDEVRKLEIMRLSDNFPSAEATSPLKPSAGFLDNDSWTVEAISSATRVDSGVGRPYYQLMRAGPREKLHFDPQDATTCAAIVTCGGLCPGENVAIRPLPNFASCLDRLQVQTAFCRIVWETMRGLGLVLLQASLVTAPRLGEGCAEHEVPGLSILHARFG